MRFSIRMILMLVLVVSVSLALAFYYYPIWRFNTRRSIGLQNFSSSVGHHSPGMGGNETLAIVRNSSYHSLGQPRVTLARIRSHADLGYVLGVYWVARCPTATGIRIKSVDGSTIDVPIPEFHRTENLQIADEGITFWALVYRDHLPEDQQTVKIDDIESVELIAYGRVCPNPLVVKTFEPN